MMTIKSVLSVIATLGMLMTLSVSQAIVVCSTTDVTFEGSDSSQCAGSFSGNDSASEIDALFGGSWIDLVSADTTANAYGSYMGVDFTLSAPADTDVSSGGWALSWTDNGGSALPLVLDFTVGIKAGTEWSAYLFEGVTFMDSPNSGNGTFSINWLNRGGQSPGLSHMSIYVTNGARISEPGSIALLGLGLVMIGVARMRKNS